MIKANLVKATAFVSGVALSAVMCGQALAVPQTEYDQVVSERDALYQQLVDAGIEPCVELGGGEAQQGATQQEGDGWKVNNEWNYSDSLGWYHYYFCTVENTSDADWDIEANVTFFDAAGGIIGVGKQSEVAVAPGYEIFLSFSNEDAFDHVAVEIKTTPSSWYRSGQQDLEVSVSDLGGKAIISATNVGDETVDFPEYNLLFLDAAGNVVEWDHGYLTDGDSEIKPGATEMRDTTTRAEYETIVAYAHGRRR